MTEINGPAASGHAAKTSKAKTPLANGRATYAEKHKVADHFIGGNKLENAPESKVKDFVATHDGHTVITNVSNSQREREGRREKREKRGKTEKREGEGGSNTDAS